MQRNKIMMVWLTLGLGLTACEGLVPDPCEGALFTYLDPEQQAACEECGDPQGCSEDDVGEPDPVEPFDGSVLCYVDSEFCAVAHSLLGGDEVKPTDDAHKYIVGGGERSGMYPHTASFSEPVVYGKYGGRFDQWVGQSWSGDAKITTTTPWRLCERTSDLQWYDGASKYYPAHYYEGPPASNWPELAECHPPDSIVGTCGLGLISIGTDPAMAEEYPQWMHSGWPREWTCMCVSDDNCQSGATCSGGYTFEFASMIPKPTVCAWPGAKEGGPGVYGLEAWGDGLTFDGTELIVTGEAFASAWLSAGLWNDAQSFEVGVTSTGQVSVDITECGERSLCAHLGLDADSTLIMGASTLIDLEAGEPVDVKVQDAVGSTSTITVIVR